MTSTCHLSHPPHHSILQLSRVFSERSDQRTMTEEEMRNRIHLRLHRTNLLRGPVVVGHDHDQLTIAVSRTSRDECTQVD